MNLYHIIYKNRENVLQIYASRIKAIVVRKIAIFSFSRKQVKSLMEILKSKGPQIDPCGKPLVMILNNLNNAS